MNESRDRGDRVGRLINEMTISELRWLRDYLDDVISEKDEDEGGAGVREPRRPYRPPGDDSVKLELPPSYL